MHYTWITLAARILGVSSQSGFYLINEQSMVCVFSKWIVLHVLRVMVAWVYWNVYETSHYKEITSKTRVLMHLAWS